MGKRLIKIGFFIVVMMVKPISGKSQFNALDSTFLSSIFTEMPYSNDSLYPGNWYLKDTFSNLFSFFNNFNGQFLFHRQDLTNAYAQIDVGVGGYDTLINPTLNYYYNLLGTVFLQTNPLIQQQFSLNNKIGVTHCTFTPSSAQVDNKTAYFIIPGSNSNQTSEIIKNTGYHNLNCTVKDQLKQFGDVYIYCKPMEDYRTLRWNHKKINAANYLGSSASTFIYDYLLANDYAYGVNYLIECLAMIKKLKQDYQKVVLLGCSLGGYSSLLASFHAPVDGVVVASGYSVLFDTDLTTQEALYKNFDSLSYSYSKDSIFHLLQQTSTPYYFSYANNDNALYQIDHDSSYTQQFLDSLENCKFYTNFSDHSFPTCSIMDSIINDIQAHPNVRFKLRNSNSTYCQTKVQFSPTGNYHFYLQRDGIIIDSFSNIQDSIILMHYTQGTYALYGASNGSISLPCYDSIYFSVSTPLAVKSESIHSLLFANPFHHQIKLLSSDNFSEEAKLIVYNILGQPITPWMTLNKIHSIDTQHWPVGTYVLHAKANGSYGYYKLNKQ